MIIKKIFNPHTSHEREVSSVKMEITAPSLLCNSECNGYSLLKIPKKSFAFLQRGLAL